MRPIEPVTIYLDRERELVMTMGALGRAERLINRQRRQDGLQETSGFALCNEVLTSMRDLVKGDDTIEPRGTTLPSAQTVHALIWAMLAEDDESITLAQVGKLLGNPFDATSKLLQAIHRYFARNNSDEEAQDDVRPLADRPNGYDSSPSVASASDSAKPSSGA